ncbi:PREDICTED: cation channel sperm-associated protein 4 [Dipodomys ordii]|uniref:Cation channel sperm-associated protein 4 n=1 Tax=Dipodomys ordii TaxID=10020 RepID=A0A1S3GIC4_DIPOR|nr:PREDICTED: cation channel sperm-associated protein 4 [Dipodomys ordii]
MAENQKAWWQQWTDTTNVKNLSGTPGWAGAVAALRTPSSLLQRNTYDPFSRHDEQVLINRLDITSRKDAWDKEEFITQMYVKHLLRHPTFQMILALLLVTNAITIALRTSSYHGQDGWNILNFVIVFVLLLGFFINELNNIAVTYTLRALRLVHVCMAVEPLARIIRVIIQSVPDMANIMALILFFMLVFSVFGVTLFGAFVPKHFQNMGVALYTLFICITQDGWLDIYRDFQMQRREYAMEIGAAIYFAIFITVGAFVGINLFVVVVTTNLEQMMKTGEQNKERQIIFSSENVEEDEKWDDELPLVHCAVAWMEKPAPQEPLVGGALPSLTENTCDNFCLVLEAIQENLKQYKQIRDELNRIVEEVRSIRYNKEQEEELLRKHMSTSLSSMSGSSVDTRGLATQQDLFSALLDREKVYESTTNTMLSKHKFNH